MGDAQRLREAVARAVGRATAVRHEIHRHPETAFEEQNTVRLVRERLAELGIEARAVAETGTVGLVRGAHPGGAVALRADMDALPILEQTGAAYASQVPGKMHACGHDGHTACLLGAAEVLAGLRDSFSGTVVLLFQPSEEVISGAARMIAEGALTDPAVEMVFALHAWPDLDAGQVGLRAGPMMAAVDNFRVTIQGRGGHGGYPHLCVDPILTAARVVDALQSIVGREVDPVDAAVVTVGSIQGGTAANIIPDTATLEGTVRTLREVTRAQVRERFHRVVEGVAAAHGATAAIAYEAQVPVTRNDEEAVALLRETAADLLGAENVVEIERPSMGGEDFSFFLQQVPGAMFRLGVGPGRPALHSSGFDFNDDALYPGILMLAGAALRALERGA